MEEKERSADERGSNVLVERVEGHYKLLSEKVTTLDGKIDRGLQDVRREMEVGFSDIQLGIRQLVKQLQEHTHAR